MRLPKIDFRDPVTWAVLTTFAAVALWVLTFALWAAAILIDREPAQGNLAGIGFLVCIVAFVFSWLAWFFWDET